jgi:hypothetical protein
MPVMPAGRRARIIFVTLNFPQVGTTATLARAAAGSP